MEVNAKRERERGGEGRKLQRKETVYFHFLLRHENVRNLCGREAGHEREREREKE